MAGFRLLAFSCSFEACLSLELGLMAMIASGIEEYFKSKFKSMPTLWKLLSQTHREISPHARRDLVGPTRVQIRDQVVSTGIRFTP
jgi:hypothetical protein